MKTQSLHNTLQKCFNVGKDPKTISKPLSNLKWEIFCSFKVTLGNIYDWDDKKQAATDFVFVLKVNNSMKEKSQWKWVTRTKSWKKEW